jgi:hypothetical protein
VSARCPNHDHLLHLNMNYHQNSFHCNLFCALLFAMLSVMPPLSPAAAGAGAPDKPAQEQGKKESRGKAFRIQFFSLKSGHSIAPAAVVLYDRGALEIKVEHEALITSRAVWSAAGSMFQADWEFTVKKEKPYHYICHFKGLYLFDTYIAGLLTLKEFIDNGRMTQDIPFIFFAAAPDK